MTTATEILSTEERDGELHHHFRWGEGPGDTDNAYERIEPMSREILDDRWRGMMGTRRPSKLHERLDTLLFDLAGRLTRRHIDDFALIDGTPTSLDVVLDIDAIELVIRDWMIERAGKVAAR